jgi:hypothetical protein
MKLHHLLIAVTTMLLALSACEQKKTATEEIKNKVDDAFDRRPNEKIRDAAEDARDSAKGVGKDLKEAAKDAKDGTKEVSKDIKEAIKNSTK